MRALLDVNVLIALSDLAHVHASEEVVIFLGHGAKLRIGFQVLQVRLDQGRPILQHAHERVLAFNGAVKDRKSTRLNSSH